MKAQIQHLMQQISRVGPHQAVFGYGNSHVPRKIVQLPSESDDDHIALSVTHECRRNLNENATPSPEAKAIK